LEWNSSEEWVRQNWQDQLPIERVLDRLLVAMERNIASRATLVAAVSRVAAEMAFEAGAREDTTIVVPNAVDIADVDSSLNGHRRQHDGATAVLGWAGSFGPWHGAEVAVEALAHLPPSVRLVMVGDGKERAACEAVARSRGVAGRIEWTGGVSRAAALRKLAECDVLVSPHTPLRDQPFFGSPTKIFEYMALGKTIVASRLGQIGDVLEHEVTALLVTPGDVHEVVAAIDRILGSPDRGLSLGEAARREAASEHTWDDRARAILSRLGEAVPAEPVAATERA
jgi:glycosyltransferase involved in cell wall biosynthesis